MILDSKTHVLPAAAISLSRLFVIMLAFTFASNVKSLSATLDELVAMPSEELVKKGGYYAEMSNHPDSALICFSIVTQRYDQKMSEEQKRNIIAAFNGKWFVYRFLYFDYGKAYENLKQSHALYEELGMNKARLWLNYGCMYQTISEPSQDNSLDEKAMSYYLKAFQEAVESDNLVIMQTSMANLVEVCNNLRRLDEISPCIDTLKQKSKGSEREKHTDFIIHMYNGISAMDIGDYETARKEFASLIDLPSEGKGDSRYQWLAYNHLAKAYASLEKYDLALDYAQKALDIAQNFDIKDAKIESYVTLSDLHKQMNDSVGHALYRNSYLQLKDTLLNYQQMAGLGELEFIDQMQGIEKKMSEVKHRSQLKDMWLMAFVIILVVTIAFIRILISKNRKLRATKNTLYEKNVAMLNVESRAREIKEESGTPKYVNSNLTDDAKARLADKIENLMCSCDEIYSSNFSADRLAELLGENYKYISQVINERMNKNFSTLVNEYRVKEACKKIENQEQYGHLTIDAVANSVGFQSINSFRAAFKRLTGLSPSEFQRIARQKAEERKKSKS